MFDRKKIVVLIHEKDEGFYRIHYFIHRLMQEWESIGLQVEVARGLGQLENADALIPHIDLTVLPEEYTAVYRRYPVVINRQLHDISKQAISQALVQKGDSYRGPVIVKTNYNSGGIPERFLLPTGRFHLPNKWGFRSRIASKLEQRLLGWKRVKTLMSYPVFDSLDDVPAGVFENPRLVVERFLPEVRRGHYCCRHYLFFGDKAQNRIVYSSDRIVKGATIVDTESLPNEPALERYRSRLGLDFGRLDYVMTEDGPVVFDINRTPAYRTDEEFFTTAAPILAQGLARLLGQPEHP
jgi:hypothetical protein